MRYLDGWGNRGAAQQFVDTTMAVSDRWPHHLRNSMHALATVMRDIDTPDMGKVTEHHTRIEREERMERGYYYERRLLRAKKHTPFYKEVARATIKAIPKGGASEWALEVVDAEGGPDASKGCACVSSLSLSAGAKSTPGMITSEAKLISRSPFDIRVGTLQGGNFHVKHASTFSPISTRTDTQSSTPSRSASRTHSTARSIVSGCVGPISIASFKMISVPGSHLPCNFEEAFRFAEAACSGSERGL